MNEDFMRNRRCRFFAISGTVTGVGGPVVGISVLYSLDGRNFTAATDSLGNYTIMAPEGSKVRISLDTGLGVTVSPRCYLVRSLDADRTGANFTLTPVVPAAFTVTGTVSGLPSNAGITVNYTINGTAGSAVTDAAGLYSFTAPAGSNIVVTPSVQAGFTPAPASYQIMNLSADVTGQNFAYTDVITVFTISGTLNSAVGPLAGVTLNYSVNGQPAVTQTDLFGNYTIRVTRGSTLIVQPLANGVAATPSNLVLTSVNQNLSGQNFMLAPLSCYALISGVVTGLPNSSNLLVTYAVNGVTATTTTNSTGRYAFVAPLSSQVTVTPPLQTGFNVSPSQYSIDNVTGDLLNQNFAYTSL